MLTLRLLPWMSWTLVLSFFSFQFILRLLPGLIMPQIMKKFHVDASHYGLLSSMYYFGYAGSQIPIAYYLDRFGPRKIVSICIFLCSMGTLVFRYSESWSIVLIGRFLIGVGSAVGFLGTVKVISQWFSKNHYARMIGVSFTLGLFGALYGGKPVAAWIHVFGWENVLTGLALFGSAIGVLVLLFLPQNGPHESKESAVQFSDIKYVLKNKNLVFLAICNLLMVGSLEGFADVWGVSYFMKSLHLEKMDAAFITSFIFVGMLFGGPLLAYLAEKSMRYYEITAFCGLFSALLFGLIFLFYQKFHSSLYLVMFLMGIFCCYQVLIFAISSQLSPSRLLGVTTAFLNCINMLGGSFFHGSIGLLLDRLWTGEMESGLRIYSLEQYKIALSIIPMASLVGSLVLLTIRPSKRKLIL